MTTETEKIIWYKRFWNWIVSLFLEEYELTVWYVYEEYDDSLGMKVTRRSERTYLLKDIRKKTPTHIRGKDINGYDFEIKTVAPFDYQITKTK